MIQCLTCKRELTASDGPRAGIAISVMGDEYTYTYMYCGFCRSYTVETYYDRFVGEAEISFFTADKQTGDRAIGLIKACPDPYDKNCSCPSHKAMYYGTPDK
jgi:hypothetical protein